MYTFICMLIHTFLTRLKSGFFGKLLHIVITHFLLAATPFPRSIYAWKRFCLVSCVAQHWEEFIFPPRENFPLSLQADQLVDLARQPSTMQVKLYRFLNSWSGLVWFGLSAAYYIRTYVAHWIRSCYDSQSSVKEIFREEEDWSKERKKTKIELNCSPKLFLLLVRLEV